MTDAMDRIEEMEGTEPLDFEGWVCPVPLRDSPTIVMGHGGGGAMSGELVEQLFLPAFGEAASAADLGDAAVVSVEGGARLAFSTDSFVVKPMFFPGGSVGDLAVNGTVNERGTVTLDPARTPVAIDLTIQEGDDAGKLQVGVIAVEGDTVVVSAQ